MKETKKMLNYFLTGLMTALLTISTSSYSQIDHHNIFSKDLKKTNQILQSQFRAQTKNIAKKHATPLTDNITQLNLTLNHILDINKKPPKLNSTPLSADTVFLGDTLVIGFTPGDELIIDSVWIHTGPIIVLGDGILKFNNANATILGNLYAVGNAQIIADSSYIYFPQQYFYQRIVLLTGHSIMEVHNSTIDFGGLVHSWATTDSALLLLDHVTKPDFSTIGMYGQSTILIDSIDVAGEFIIDDSVQLEIERANTVLLWHQFGQEAEIDISFPDGEYIDNYNFSDSEPGVIGVNYNIQISDCETVWWGLMPSNGSDVTITNSELRTIGLWFEGNDSSNVSGLVNNTFYDNFTAPLDDRYLHLNNCDVMTWSIYTFDAATVDISGSILGEIGVMGHSVVNTFNTFIDGSGGYFFSTDTTFSVLGFSSLTSSLRSSGNSFLIFAYASQMNGIVQALENSVLMLIQSTTTEPPTFDAGSVVWMANIMFPSSGFVDSVEPIFGSAWIDKGAESNLMDFDHYTMYYQKDGDTTWYTIGTAKQTEVREDSLINWNTHGLQAGAYFLKLELTDNWGNAMEATKAFTLLPLVLKIDDDLSTAAVPRVYPNPFIDYINFEIRRTFSKDTEVHIFDALGKEMMSIVRANTISETHIIRINAGKLPSGIYYYRIRSGDEVSAGKLIKY